MDKIEAGDLVFQNEGMSLEFKNTGDVYFNGRKITEDWELVQDMKRFAGVASVSVMAEKLAKEELIAKLIKLIADAVDFVKFAYDVPQQEAAATAWVERATRILVEVSRGYGSQSTTKLGRSP